MLAYNKDRLNAWINGRMVEDAAGLGLITEAEKTNILITYPSGFFNPKTIVRIGLGFATLVASSMFSSLVGLILTTNIGVVLLTIGVILLLILEHLIRKRLHFRSGIDDILLYQGYGLLLSGFMLIFQSVESPELIISAIATVLAALASIRYADRIMVFCTFVGLILFTGFLLDRTNRELLRHMPLFCLLISSLTWYVSHKIRSHATLIYYRHCFDFLQVLALATAALASNYYFVMEIWLKGLFYGKTTDRSFWNWFYIATTVLLPLATLVTGFMAKDKIRIRLGVLMAAAAIMTFHYYLTSTPNEVLCILYGSILLVVSYVLLKYYKPRKNGVSFHDRGDPKAFHELESLLLGAGVGMIIHEPPPGRFGGGSFGGAGAGGKF